MGKKSGDMKSFWCVFLYFSLQLLLLMKCVSGSLNFHEDTSVSSGSTGTVGKLVKKEERMPVVATEFGEISAVDIDDGTGMGQHNYHLQFITLEPNSLFLPVLLHADMVFYVQTGGGKISWTNSDEKYKVNLQRGDVYRLRSGTLFYIHSSLEAERPRLRIIAIFANPEAEQLQGPSIGPYSSINDLVRGFDKRVLQAAFQVPEEVIEELTSAIDTPAIVHAEPKRKNFWQQELLFINAFLGIQRDSKQVSENKKKQTKTFNFFKEDPDFKNCNGWSTMVTKHNLDALHGSHIGVFMVNLTKGSMMGPHWNPMATEVSVVLEGEGMVRVVCPSTLTNKECKNSRFRIEEGDVYTVPRFHPMAQTSFNNGSLVFMGFSTTTKNNHPQFLIGKASVLQTLSKPILGASFNVSNTTIEQLLGAQEEAIILDCTSCAEEQEMLMEDEIEKERQEEEERRKEEEEARRRKEEERRKREEEEQRREEEEREKEERRKREEEEEEIQREEEERHREEEEQRRQEEEERHREEEEQRKREEEERRREEEEQRRQEEEEERHREEEEQRKREEEEEERQREEEEQRRHEEEEEQRRRREEEKQQEEEEERRREEEEKEQEEEQRSQEEERREREEQQRRREEKRQRQEEEREEREEQQRREEEERQRQEQEEEAARQKEKRRQEEERRREEEEWRRREEKGRGEEEETEQEIARREEEERRREWERQAEEAARRRRERYESEGGSREEGKRFLRRTTKVSEVS